MRKRWLIGGCAVILLGGCITLSVLGAVGAAVRGQQAATARTAMPEPGMIEWYRDNADPIDPRALAADTASYIGRNVTLTGTILGVSHNDQYTWAQLMAEIPARRGQTESVVTYWRPKNPSVLRDERFQIWGIVQGTEEVRRQLTGATNSAPVVEVYTYTVRPR